MVNFVKKVLLSLLVLSLLLSAAGCGTSAPSPSSQGAAATFTPEPTATPPPSPEPTPSPSPPPQAPPQKLAENMGLSDNYGGYLSFLTDGDLESWVTYKYGTEIYIDSEEEIGSLYICWFRIPLLYATVRCGGASFPAAENGYIYEYIELPEPTRHGAGTWSWPSRPVPRSARSGSSAWARRLRTYRSGSRLWNRRTCWSSPHTRTTT